MSACYGKAKLRLMTRLLGLPLPARNKGPMSQNPMLDSDPRSIDHLNQQVEQLLRDRRFSEAIERATEAKDTSRQLFGDGHPGYAVSLDTLAWVYESMGNHASAESLYRQALEIKRAALGENHPE